MSNGGPHSLTLPTTLRVVQGDVTFYLASMKASDLFRVCAGLRQDTFRERLIDLDEVGAESDEEARKFVKSISTSAVAADVESVAATPYGEDDPFQRLIDETRVRKIAAYLTEDFALIPNSIILAIRDATDCEIGRGSTPSVTLEWDGEVPTNIIDGQHRVEALRLHLSGNGSAERFFVPVCILVDLPYYAQAEMFAVINGRQKQVSRSRIYDLLGYMPIKDPAMKERAYKGEMAIHRFCHHVVRVLNSSAKSPWHERIKMRGTAQGLVTQAAFGTDLARLVAPRRDTPKLARLPVFFPYFQNNDLVGLAKVCIIYFLGVARAWPSHWEQDAALKPSLFAKSNGIAVMFLILHDLVMLAGGPEALTVDEVQRRWALAPQDRIDHPPTGGSRGYQAEWYQAMMSEMVGANFAQQVAAAAEPVRQRLRAIGGLYR